MKTYPAEQEFPPMKVFNSPCIFVDVDDTLVLWGKPWTPNSIAVTCCGHLELLEPHQLHIDFLKRAKKNGNCIVVWSAAGAEWAQDVIRALGLQKNVDIILSKPTVFVDDQPGGEILPESQRVFLNRVCQNAQTHASAPISS